MSPGRDFVPIWTEGWSFIETLPNPSSPQPREQPDGRDVFRILANENAEMLSSYLRSLLGGVGGADAATVDDLFQAAMIVAWRRLADFDRSRSFGMWLRGIARNLVLEHARKAAHRLSVDDPRVMAELDARYDTFTSGGRIFGERADDVLRCLANLPTVMREAMEMVYARGMLLRQIAVALEVAEETIKKRVQRGRVAVAECLRAQGHGTGLDHGPLGAEMSS